MKRNLFFIFIMITLSFSIHAQDVSSKSYVDWTSREFHSTVDLDVTKSKIQLPSERSAAQSIINLKIPLLLKDPLLSLPVDSSKNLGDDVLREIISLETITNIVEDSRKSPPHYVNETDAITVEHDLKLNEISSSLIMHSIPYSPKQTVNRIATRPYTGIIIDARGMLPVHGEFVSSKAKPCFFPKVWNESMDLIYEKNMEDSSIAKRIGICTYHYSTDETLYEDRIGTDPLRITAKKIFGINRTDPVISEKDALRILSSSENRELLKQGRIVILLDKPELVYTVVAPEKGKSYYLVYRNTEEFYYKRKIHDVKVKDTYKGIQISVRNLKFAPDSNELLPEEKDRFDSIYEQLNNAIQNQDNEFSILVEGHTASTGRPEGEMNLSVERAKTIVNELIKRGIKQNVFSYKGYGGTVPVGDNSTAEGRAQNRRVEITLIPRSTSIQRR